MSGTFTLSAEQLDRLAELLADRVAEKLGDPPADKRAVSLDTQSIMAIAELVTHELQAPAASNGHGAAPLVSAAELAQELGVKTAWVYQHRDRLGGIRLGAKGARLRFDPERARQAINAPQTPAAPPLARRKRRQTVGSVLKVRG